MVPANAYDSQALHSTPGLPTRLPTNIALPGTWMSIIGMLKAPTTPERKVVVIWGAYWKKVRKAEVMPRNCAYLYSSGWGGELGRRIREATVRSVNKELSSSRDARR
jgi:hypothetical protein